MSLKTQQLFKQIMQKSQLIQAPLAGISCSAMRDLSWQFGGLAYACSEMLSSHQLAYDLDRSPRYHHISCNEGPVCFQLAGQSDELLAKAAIKAQQYGAQLIDYNVGCPKPKIRKKGFGSILLSESKKLQRCLQALRSTTECPLTVKIRVDGQHDTDYNSSVLEACLAAEVDAIIVHGRNWQDDYTIAVSYQDIAFFKQNANVPIIANGDLFDGASIKSMLAQTKADYFMLGRSIIGKPWLFKKIELELLDEKPLIITADTQIKLFLQHVEGLAKLDGEHSACLQSRRLAKHYFTNHLSRKTIQSLQLSTSLQEVHSILSA